MRIFSLPDYNFSLFNRCLLLAMAEHREWFYDDFQIESVYGTPFHCIWNGLKNPEGGWFELPHEFKRDVLDYYQSKGVKYRLYFANFMLKSHQKYDLYGNTVARYLEKIGGDVIVSTQEMFEHMQQYYNLKVGWSDITDYGSDEQKIIDTVNRLSENSFVILPHYWCHDEGLLSGLKNKDNIELQVGACCDVNLLRCRKHREHVNLYNIYECDSAECLLVPEGQAVEILHSNVSSQELDRLEQQGFKRFVINAFALTEQQVLNSYMYLFVRPEYGQAFIDMVNNEVLAQAKIEREPNNEKGQ